MTWYKHKQGGKYEIMTAKQQYLARLLCNCIENDDLSYTVALLEKRADPNMVLEHGAAAIHIAAGTEKKQYLELILRYDGDPNVRSSEGSTPLHTAAAYGCSDNLQLLLSHGGDPDLLDQDNMTVYDNVKQSGCEMCNIYLKMYQQSVRNTPVIQASKTDELKLLRIPENHTEEISEDTGHYTMQIQSALDGFDPACHQIDVTSPNHPKLVPRYSDDAPLHSSAVFSPHSAQAADSSGTSSFHTCEDSESPTEQRKPGNPPSSPLTFDPESPSSLQSASPSQTSSVQYGMGGMTSLSGYSSEQSSPDYSVRSEDKSTPLCSQVSNKPSQSVVQKAPSYTESDFQFNGADLPSLAGSESLKIPSYSPPEDPLVDEMKNLSIFTEDLSILSALKGNVPQRYAIRRPNGKEENTRPKWRSPPLTSSRCSSLDSSTASVRTETCIHVDEQDGFKLLETRYIPSDIGESFQTNQSVIESNNATILYDWKDASLLSNGSNGSGEPGLAPIPPELDDLTNVELHKRLKDLGDTPGPITRTTRKTYMRRLARLIDNPTLATNNTSTSTDFLLELEQVLSGRLDLSSLAVLDLEAEMTKPFLNPDPSKHWREGTKKTSFTYLLLDPRVTQNLPLRAKFIDEADALRCFLKAVFYVGKGKRSRPYGHFKEAIKHITKPTGKPASAKVSQILDIWSGGLGVVSLHVFQNVMPCEAFTREACMIDAFGLSRLTNKMPGQYYGPAASWPMKTKRLLGAMMLRKAFRILLSEGERQLQPHDIYS